MVYMKMELDGPVCACYRSAAKKLIGQGPNRFALHSQSTPPQSDYAHVLDVACKSSPSDRYEQGHW